MALRGARLRRLGPELSRMAGARFRRDAADPVAIDVTLDEPLDRRPQDAAPLIELNGVPLTNTHRSPDAPDRLVAFLPERRLLKKQNEVRVIWHGSAQATRSLEPRTISDEPEDD